MPTCRVSAPSATPGRLRTIAAAVWSGHRYAEELDEPQTAGPVPYLREVTELASEPVMYLPITPAEPARI